MRYIFHYILFYLPFVFLVSQVKTCSKDSRSSSNQNLSHIYKSEQDVLHPAFEVFHRTNTTSELHFKIGSQDLLYNKQGSGENVTAHISIQYKLISSYETKDIIDSATVELTDPYSKTPKDLLGKIEINATFTNSYILEINFSDLNRNVTSKSFITLDKENHDTRQNYLVLSAENKTPIFKDNIGKNERILIRYRIPDTKVYVRYYHRNFPLPSPPFATSNMTPFEYRADSLFTLQLNEKDTTGFIFSKQGFYHIQADTNTRDGLTLFRFYDGFPMVKTPELLLQPLRFLTTRQEYDAMASYKNLKAAVDSFWVYAGGSHERGRELVKKFYNRVQNSNKYFSSYVEGWKTDRGLIYLIYGPPNIVYKNTDSENWVYGEENNFNSLTFTFLKVINPFTGNDYRLDRNQLFKTSWFNAVDMWRQGRIYTEK